MSRINDPSIADEDALWRRILSQWIKSNGKGGWRPSSAAFLDNRSGEVSVNVARLTSVECIMAKYTGQSLAVILARLPRSLGHIVAFDKTPEDASHAVICPPPERAKNHRKRDAHAMAEQSRWVVPPSQG